MTSRRRSYIDVTGKIRNVALVEEKPHLFVVWHKKLPGSSVCIWRLEDGSLVQIPDNAWFSHAPHWTAPIILLEQT